MFEKAISKLREEFKELENKLQDPDVISDNNKFKELSQKYAKLKKNISIIDEYENAQKEVEEYKEMLKEAFDDEELKESIEKELIESQKKLQKLEEKVKLALVPPSPEDHKNAIMEIRAGTGGEEAAIFAGDLYRMYVRFAERQGFKIEIMSSTPSDLGGYKEIIFMVSGPDAYGLLKYEGGVHRVQRVPVTESQGRIHTSAASVVVMPEAEEFDIDIKEEDLRVDTFRASGAGGQYVNKTESAVRITHIPTGIVVSCQDERSQHQNKEKALRILRSKLYEIEMRKRMEKESSMRKSMVRSGDRSEKIRTYNFPQNRVTDHRINLTLYNLEEVLDGDIMPFIEALKSAEYEEYFKKL